MSQPAVTAHLNIVVSGRQVFAEITFHNPSADPVHLDKLKAGLTEPVEGKLFEVTLDGAPVEYIGPMSKRAAPGPDDYYALAPQDSVRTRAVLSNLYAIRPSPHAYHVRYSTYHGYPDRAGIWVLMSNEAAFTLR